jgi:hypothetical protein
MSPVDNTGTTRPSSVSSGANVSRASSAGNQISINGTEFARLVAHSNSLWEELKNVKSQLEVLRQELGAAQDREGNLSLRVEESNESLARITSGLESARAVHTKDEATILEKEGELTAIQEELASTKESLTRSQMYLTADRDIRDLMGARNLRIIDVFDVDGKGKTKRPFGRIFFTEGRSLIFYAFDLENAKPSFAAASYQGWGYQGGTQSAVRSLGIFYQDDQKANRWVLKFDDPEVLTEIDSVFVTIEPPGGSKKPTGNRLLAAYMKANLNHP